MYFRRDGHALMHAELSDYQKVSGSTVLAPRRMHIAWLPDKGRLELEFGTMARFDKPAAEIRFRSPLQRGFELGTVQRVDRPPLPATTPTTHPDQPVTQ